MSTTSLHPTLGKPLLPFHCSANNPSEDPARWANAARARQAEVPCKVLHGARPVVSPPPGKRRAEFPGSRPHLLGSQTQQQTARFPFSLLCSLDGCPSPWVFGS